MLLETTAAARVYYSDCLFLASFARLSAQRLLLEDRVLVWPPLTPPSPPHHAHDGGSGASVASGGSALTVSVGDDNGDDSSVATGATGHTGSIAERWAVVGGPKVSSGQ